jgi:predicted transcriptional regulator
LTGRAGWLNVLKVEGYMIRMKKQHIQNAGLRLLKVRSKRRLSQSAMARMLRVTQPCVSLIETGKMLMSEKIRLRLSEIVKGSKAARKANEKKN